MWEAVTKRKHEFDDEHKQGELIVQKEGWFYFADGAYRENSPWPPLHEPPQQPKENAKARLRYWEIRLEYATHHFVRLRQHLSNAARNAVEGRQFAVPPSEAQYAELEELHKQVLRCKESRDKVQAELDAFDAKTPKQLADEARRLEEAREMQAQIDKLKV